MLHAASLKNMLEYGGLKILIFSGLSITKQMKSKVKSIRRDFAEEGIE